MENSPNVPPKDSGTPPQPTDARVPSSAPQQSAGIPPKDSGTPSKEIKIIGPDPTTKKKLSLKAIAIIGTSIAAIAGIIVGSVFLTKTLKNKTVSPRTEQPPVVETPEQEDTNKTTTYVNNVYEFSFEYPKELSFEQLGAFTEEPLQYRVIYAGETQKGSVKKEADLTDGYIFKIYIHEKTETPLEEIVKRKIDKAKLDCAETTKLSERAEIQLNGISGYTFEVENCPPDYIYTLVNRNGHIFELIQIHRGDLGFRQAYKTQTETILNTFKFLGQEPETTTTERFFSTKYGFSFEHSKLSDTCCSLTGPAGNSIEKLGILGDESTKNAKEAFNGVGIFIDQNPNQLDFDKYMIEQKQALVREYQVITGELPVTNEDVVKVGKLDGILLQGYAWWGDVVYVQLPERPEVLIVVKSQISAGSFNTTFSEILNSFEF